MSDKVPERDRVKARRILETILAELGWNRATLAKHASLTPSTITRFLGNPEKGRVASKGMGTNAALKIHVALQEAGVEEAKRRALLQAVGVDETISRALFVQDATVETATVQAITGHDHRPRSTTSRSSTQSGEQSAQEALDVLWELGIELDRREIPRFSTKALIPLVNGGTAPSLLHRTLATIHLGHSLLNEGQHDRAADYLTTGLYLIEEGKEHYRQHYQAKMEELAIPLTARGAEEVELWCQHLLALSKTVSDRQHNAPEVRGRLRAVIKGAKGRPSLNHVRGNALRDLAWFEIVMSGSAPKVEGTRPEERMLDESVSLLEDSPDRGMLAITKLRRAQWHQMRGNERCVQNDIEEAIKIAPADPFVRIEGFVSAAEVMASVDINQAKRYARSGLRAALESGHQSQAIRARAILQRPD